MALYVLYGPITAGQDLSSFDSPSRSTPSRGPGDQRGIPRRPVWPGADAVLLEHRTASRRPAGIAYIPGPLSGDVGVSTAKVFAYGENSGDEVAMSRQPAT